jgi:4-hydroxy-3-polyprenylbenzoate decarboxylase
MTNVDRSQFTNTGPEVVFNDLREWIREAEALGEIRVRKGLDWEREIGMVTELICHDDKPPCVLFEDIPRSLPGSRVLVNFFGGKRKNMTLGFPTSLDKRQLSEAYRASSVNLAPMARKTVRTGPIFENRMTGPDIDVTLFPSPIWHEGDEGNRYIGTGSYDVTRDPEDGWVNCGTYRVMVHDKRSLGLYISPGKHGRVHRDKYAARGEPMPVAIVVGGDPLTFLMACSEVPYGICEYDVVGGMRGRPMEVVEGPVTGLPFPAHAEIVIEGYVHPGNVRKEGPFGEWTGYYASDSRPEPVVDIHAIHYRNDPIILGSPPHCPPDEQARYRAIVRSALLRENLEKAGVPGVASVWAHEAGGSRLILGVAIEQRYAGHSTQAGHIAAQCHVGAYCGRYVMVVDDDIDPSNLDELMWAVATRSDPATSISIIRNAWSTPLDPRIEPERKAAGDNTNSRAIIDACRPWHWRERFPKVNRPDIEMRRRARKRFGDLLE